MNRHDMQDFTAFADECVELSYAQRLQDLWALWESGFPRRKGYYIEFGALNGRDFSNTYILEQLGWDGVIAEPHPAYEKLVRANRKCKFSTKCVFDKTGETVVFHAVKGRPAMSSIGTHMSRDDKFELRQSYVEHEIETISLVDLLRWARAPKEIDFLSIDTEGSELAILSAFDFDAYNIKLICVEHNDVMRDDLFALLSSKGYERKWTEASGHDDWYYRKGSYPDWSADDRNALVEMMKKKVSPFENQLEKRRELVANLKASRR